MTTPPPGFKVVDGLFADSAAVIDWAEAQAGWEQSQVDAENRLDEGRTSDSLSITMLSFAHPDLVHSMNRRVWEEMDAYAKEYEITFSGIEPASLNRYAIGQEYRQHIDFNADNLRVISAVLYLNDIAEGGETRFTCFDFTVEPKAGRLVLFPSNFVYRHAALAPRSGTKYAVAYWARA